MKKLIVSAIALVMGVTMLTSTILAGEGEKEKQTKANPYISGKVEVLKDGETITEIKIVGKEETVLVVIDDKGKELAAMEGKEVKVKGEKNAEGKIVVSEFKEKTSKSPKKQIEKHDDNKKAE